ncbi:uncharacterized protein N7483_006991 [Penicillium malachiteum]|uniref:uncharacterized protein n=1 Tax=Penicillium malachiteum TaxID=1324776 RepID=UPI0025472C35|nr:uncharacterized protein N7483_006991 [Penicillium malachiteum]KAJ5725634.1 hypothetical protein N7483_006991 [Penicillium malachiteum]
MVTGIEAAGLALAILPLFVNQIDAYARGIEKIKGLRRYRREFKGYSVGLRSQYAILLNTLTQALEGVVNDEDQVSELIRDTKGNGWKDPELERRLRLKLNRDYDVYIDNVSELSERLERLSQKLDIGLNDMKSPVTEAWNIWKLRKILDRAVYEDLLAKITEINTVLKTLIDQSDLREDNKKKRQTWHYLLKRYQKARRHAQGLFKAITGGNYWQCPCKEQHCVHIQLQTNPLDSTDEYFDREVDTQSQFKMIFSNANQTTQASLWTWTEVEFEPWQVEEIVKIASLSLHEDTVSNNQKRRRVQFDIPSARETLSLKPSKEAPPIHDFCTSLCVFRPNETRRECIGSISNELDASVKYTMHAVKTLSTPIPQRSLREVLSHISRQDRLYIATGLACGVIQFHDNWLKAWWDSSDVYLAAASDGRKVLLDSMYLSWSFSSSNTSSTTGPNNGPHQPPPGNNRLLPLGLALVELSTGKSIQKLIDPDDENGDIPVTKLETASRLVEMVYKESGTNYADAVNSCLSWSTLCLEKRFEERVFETIVSPLLRDLVNF